MIGRDEILIYFLVRQPNTASRNGLQQLARQSSLYSEKNDKEILALFLHLIYDGMSAIMALDDGRFFKSPKGIFESVVWYLYV